MIVAKLGALIHVARYNRQDLRVHPDRIYVFGDNMAQVGLGGQARECRGEPNAVGIPTKWRPAIDETAYFVDADLDQVKPRIKEAFRRLLNHRAAGGDIIWPADGVGTGLAQLPRRAPAIHAFIQQCYEHLLSPRSLTAPHQ